MVFKVSTGPETRREKIDDGSVIETLLKTMLHCTCPPSDCRCLGRIEEAGNINRADVASAVGEPGSLCSARSRESGEVGLPQGPASGPGEKACRYGYRAGRHGGGSSRSGGQRPGMKVTLARE